MKYILMPFLAWFVSGSLKFCINYLRFGKRAKQLVGYGGFPSTHTTIISSAVFLVGFEYGFVSAAFSLGISILLIIIIDAHGLRKNIGKQAQVINYLSNHGGSSNGIILRENMGHTWCEIMGGLALGFLISLLGIYL